jgi:hypothetical protein
LYRFGRQLRRARTFSAEKFFVLASRVKLSASAGILSIIERGNSLKVALTIYVPLENGKKCRGKSRHFACHCDPPAGEGVLPNSSFPRIVIPAEHACRKGKAGI